MRSETEKLIREKFVRLVAGAPVVPVKPEKKILLLSIPRSGSSWICDQLRLTETFGTPDEWFNTSYFQVYNELFRNGKTKIDEYIKFLFDTTVTANGVFSIKIHISQFQFWRAMGFEPLSLGFDRIFFLYRIDKIAQAVSLATSEITDIWLQNDQLESPEDFILPKNAFINALSNIYRQETEFASMYSDMVDGNFAYEDVVGPDSGYFFSQFFLKSGLMPPPSIPKSEMRKETGFSKKKNVELFKAQINEKGMSSFLSEVDQATTQQSAFGTL